MGIQSVGRLRPCLLFILVPWLAAQPKPVPYDKTAQWLSYFTDVSLNPGFALHFDTSYRSIGDSAWKQWVVRPGVTVDLTEDCGLSLTYGYFKANPNGFGVDTYAVPEHRVHQQFTYRQDIGPVLARHRIRNEQRWIGTEFVDQAEGEYRFQERLRYQFRTDIPLRAGPGEKPSLFLSVYDEVAVRFGFRGASYFDQNRLYGGIGFRPNPSTTIECGAFGQRFKPLSGGRLENNVMILLSVSTDFSLRR